MLHGVRPRSRLVVLSSFVLATAVGAACAGTDQGVTATRSRQIETASTDPVPETTQQPLNTDPDNPLDPPDDTTPAPPADEVIIDFGAEKTPQPYDNFLNAAFADVNRFWEENFEAVYGAPWQPLSAIYAHYPERSDLPESCQGGVPYEEVEANAFYTTCGDIIVYDDSFLLPDLVDKLGTAAVGVVAAHEFGHAIQARAGVFDLDLPTIATEQQADCFAGAWAARIARGESPGLQFTDTDVKGGIIAMIEVRDPPGTDSANDGSGHGTAFDRVGAFQEGFINGIERCVRFIDEPNPRIDLVFTEADIDTQGNLPFPEILALLPPSLDTFWVPTLEASGVPFTPPTVEALTAASTCDGRGAAELENTVAFCLDANTIVYDEVFAQDVSQRIGDSSFGYLMAAAYADAVQHALSSTLTGEPRVLLNDCLIGPWINDIVPDDTGVATNPNQQVQLSAGDLDEIVLTAVLLGDEATSTNVLGTAFEKIDAVRAGVLGGMASCQARIG